MSKRSKRIVGFFLIVLAVGIWVSYPYFYGLYYLYRAANIDHPALNTPVSSYGALDTTFEADAPTPYRFSKITFSVNGPIDEVIGDKSTDPILQGIRFTDGRKLLIRSAEDEVQIAQKSFENINIDLNINTPSALLEKILTTPKSTIDTYPFGTRAIVKMYKTNYLSGASSLQTTQINGFKIYGIDQTSLPDKFSTYVMNQDRIYFLMFTNFSKAERDYVLNSITLTN